jgi:hypothetical protein
MGRAAHAAAWSFTARIDGRRQRPSAQADEALAR